MRTLALLLRVAVVVVLPLSGCESVKSDVTDAAVHIDGSSPIDSASPPDAVSCTAEAFQTCADDSTARFCNASGNGFDDRSCGAPGCNLSAGRCNECVPSSATCSSGSTPALSRCSSDGLTQPDQACQLACVGENGTTAAHCAFLVPKYLPDVCATPATDALFAVDSASINIDTNLDNLCNGGIVTQPGGGPPLCVMRYGQFRISAGRQLKVTGARVLAVVTDDKLELLGTLDVSADGTMSGPGSVTASGVKSSNANGGGGAGFAQNGAAGGSANTDGAGGAGGAAFDPLPLPLRGGPRSPTQGIAPIGANGGGGGGAATLISCRGTVTVSGALDAGGGGGQGGSDEIFGPQISLYAAAGGGAGGYVVLQGLDVAVSGQVFANGGGGGGGGANDAAGGQGGDGGRSTSPTAGGSPLAGSGAGGSGGAAGFAPGVGKRPPGGGSAGGGGGSMGHFQVYAPSGVNPVVTPSAASPGFDALQRVGTL